jgi:hypothetical protein
VGLIFFFYANDHMPVHVHVKYGEHETKLEFVYENGRLVEIKAKKARGRIPLPDTKMGDAIFFAKQYHAKIVDKWTDFFVLHKKPKNEKIFKKLK